jgi:hypothetical protein
MGQSTIQAGMLCASNMWHTYGTFTYDVGLMLGV